MQLPAELREATQGALEGVSRNALAERALRISGLYRAGAPSASAIRDDLDALAYVVSRLPATYAAARHTLGRLAERCPGFAPRSVLDLGAGPGTASWAAVDAWPSIESIAQADSSTLLMRFGAKLAEHASSNALRDASRIVADFTQSFHSTSKPDLILLSYTLAELSLAQSVILLTNAWLACSGALVIVEPGTPQGYARILGFRELLLRAGAHIAAPCPHEFKCPLTSPDWCHFAQRVARSRDHKLVKSADVPYEDEKFSYLIAVREHLFQRATTDRILALPQIGKAAILVKVCKANGRSEIVTIGRRDPHFKSAKKKGWGDPL